MFADLFKRDAAKALTPETYKIEAIVVEIRSSCCKGTYLLIFDSEVKKWINSSDCPSIQGMVNAFHKPNPGAPNTDDYCL